MKLNALLDLELIDSEDIRKLLLEEGFIVNELLDKDDLMEEVSKGVVNVIFLKCCPVITSSDDISSTIKQCKELDPRIEIICLGLHKDEEIAIEAIKHGATACISTPFDQLHFRETILDIKDHAQYRQETYNKEKAHFEHLIFNDIVSKNPVMLDIFTLVKRVAPYYRTMMISGETGTGKEVLARRVHKLSQSSNEPFIACNCSGFVETLLESELFGHVKGAFTDATSDKKGLFEAAGNGTLFLDEIGDMPLGFQAHLLRVLQDGEIRPVGSTQTMKAKCRVIAASNVDLEEKVKKGLFREDLYFRLAVITIDLPALRERKEDIRLLCYYLMNKFKKSINKKVTGISIPAQRYLVSYDWPGNVRELENVIERAILVTTANFIRPQDLPPYIKNLKLSGGDSLSIDELMKNHIQRVLVTTGGNKTKASSLLGISRRALQRKIEKYNISL
jgi:DNA-binding NtrC family response regulator